MKLQKLLVVGVGLFLAGTIIGSGVFAQETAEEEKKFVTAVIFGESVEKDEAIEIGKEFLQFKGIADQYYLIKRNVFPSFLVKELYGEWHVVFLKKNTDEYEIGEEQSIRIIISPVTGQVIDYGEQDGFYVER